MKCAEGYYFDTPNCVAIENCLIFAGNDCLLCDEGFANTETDNHCSNDGGDELCNETDANGCVDGKPGVHFYGTNPCPYGKKWDTDKCVDIENPYCAIVEENGDCLECFSYGREDNYCKTLSTIFF